MSGKHVLMVAGFWAVVAAMVGWAYFCLSVLGEEVGPAVFFVPVVIPLSVFIYHVFKDIYP